MPKATTPRRGQRHNPLEQDLLATGPLREASSKRQRKDEKSEDEHHFIDAKSSTKILRIGRELIEEDHLQESNALPKDRTFDFESTREGDRDQDGEMQDDGEVWGDEDDLSEGDELVEPDDLQVFNRFLPAEDEDPLLRHGWGGKEGDEAPASTSGGTNLADLILARIAEYEAAAGASRKKEPQAVDEDVELPPKVVDVFTK